MPIEAIYSANIQPSAASTAGIPSISKNAQVSFCDLLERLSSYQDEADEAIDKLIAGEEVDLHEVMLSAERADIAFRVAMQLRNKLVQAYEEVMRMQV